MQINRRDYNPELHEVFKALTVKQPYADLLTRVTGRYEDGTFFADKRIEVRSKPTKFRGDILICSSAKPVLPGHESAVTCGFVELYDIKPVSAFTEEDWAATCIPEEDRPTGGWGWLVRNPRRVVEMPIRGQLGIYNLIVPKDDITIYPQHLMLDDDGFAMVNSKIYGNASSL